MAWRPTLPSSGRSEAGFACFRLPLGQTLGVIGSRSTCRLMCSLKSSLPVCEPKVAAFAANPDNARAWYVKSAERSLSDHCARVAGRLVAHFLGERLAYMYEVTELGRCSRRLTRRYHSLSEPCRFREARLRSIYSHEEDVLTGARKAPRTRNLLHRHSGT